MDSTLHKTGRQLKHVVKRTNHFRHVYSIGIAMENRDSFNSFIRRTICVYDKIWNDRWRREFIVYRWYQFLRRSNPRYATKSNRWIFDTVNSNPANASEAKLQIGLTTAENVNVQVMDISGKIIASKNLGLLNFGEHTVYLSQIMGIQPNPGAYLIRIDAGSHTAMRKWLCIE